MSDGTFSDLMADFVIFALNLIGIASVRRFLINTYKICFGTKITKQKS